MTGDLRHERSEQVSSDQAKSAPTVDFPLDKQQMHKFLRAIREAEGASGSEEHHPSMEEITRKRYEPEKKWFAPDPLKETTTPSFTDPPSTRHAPRLKPLTFGEGGDPTEKSCVLGLWPGEGNKIVFTGHGCEYKIEPRTPQEQLIHQIEREFEKTPEYKRSLPDQRLLRWMDKGD